MGINGPQKAKSGDKNFVSGSLIIDQAKLAGQLKNEIDDNSLPITSTLKIPRNIETTHFFYLRPTGSGEVATFVPGNPKSFRAQGQGHLGRDSKYFANVKSVELVSRPLHFIIGQCISCSIPTSYVNGIALLSF